MQLQLKPKLVLVTIGIAAVLFGIIFGLKMLQHQQQFETRIGHEYLETGYRFAPITKIAF